jgi:polyphosphate kinase
MDSPDLKRPELYINRELSLLEFNHRVLEQAKISSIPLLERLNYLCISCSNLDEFFEVRAAGVIQKMELGSSQKDPDNLSPGELLAAISERAHVLVSEQYRVLNEVLIPLLEAEKIRFLRRRSWTKTQRAWLYRYFKEELLPVLNPLGLDPAHPFPRILNKGLTFIISLTGKDAFGRSIGKAILPAPRALPRIIRLPEAETGSGPYDFVFLSSIIHDFVEELFQGVKIQGCYQFRVTRNSDLFVHEEEVDDLLRAVEGELAMRNYGDEVRLEIADNCPDHIADFLLTRFGMTRDRLYIVDGPVNLNRIGGIYDLIDRPELKFVPFTPRVPESLQGQTDWFREIRRQPILLHHPFESFTPVIEFLRQAADDPDVLSIKQTLYRTGPKSPIVDALVSASRAGKEVMVVIELRARFDEKDNISLATRLQEAAVHVVYGVVGYKTHAKMMLVLRREGRKLRSYVHIGSGNYHPSTARLYTDYGLLTCDPDLVEDVQRVFVQLTSLGKLSKLKKLLQSPFTLHEALLNKIEREIENKLNGKPARIIFKLNSLVEPQAMEALFRASMAGVEIKLIVRGICCLRPGIERISDNIEVRSIIGRFLEHTRVYYFENEGEPEIFVSSADLMNRNMFHRVEVAFPIEFKKHRDRIIRDLEYYLADNTHAWIMQPDGTYKLLTPADSPPFEAQTALLASE